MTTSVQTFAFLPHGTVEQPVSIRTIEIDGEPWFVAADVCRGLGLKLTSGSAWQHLQKLEASERKVIKRKSTANPYGGIGYARLFSLGVQSITVISESGLYRLLMRADKPEAKAFQDWVTREVIPSIRKTGGYLLNETARETAHADTRTEMPLPAAFKEAFDVMAKATLAMGEMLAQSLDAQKKGLEQQKKTDAKVSRMEAQIIELTRPRDRRMMTAGQLSKLARFRDSLTPQEIGSSLGDFCGERGYETHLVGSPPVRTYPVFAVEEWFARRKAA